MPTTPAGTEIRVRMPGTSRPSRTAAWPRCANQALARSMSAMLKVSHRQCRAAKR